MADVELGRVVLHATASLVFTVSHWKGRQYAHVRKFISTGKYTGPAKAGISFVGEVLVQVIDALSQLQLAVPGAHGQEFARISKRGEVDIVISTIAPDDLQSLPAVDIREHVDLPGYTGPTKKGIRFNWEKLSEVIALMRTQAGRLGAGQDEQPMLFPDAKPKWVEQATVAAAAAPSNRDAILAEALPDGPKRFPLDFLDGGQGMTTAVELPAEAVEVAQLRDGKWAVRSSLGFCHPVRNAIEGNFIYYAYLREERTIRVPNEMIVIFRTVKKYENYLRELHRSLMQAYERKSGHRPMAEHQTKEVFRGFGLPWLEES
jgi:hypothetical protein